MCKSVNRKAQMHEGEGSAEAMFKMLSTEAGCANC